MTALLKALRGRVDTDRRGIALIMVMMVVSSLLIIGILFAGSVTAEYRAAVYYRQAIQSEQYCIVGLHRAMAELSYDVWGVYEDRPFLSARYNPDNVLTNITPDNNLLALTDSAYYDMESGSFEKITRQRGYWNGHAWVVWADTKVAAPAGFTTAWENMDPRPELRAEMKGGAQPYISYGSSQGTVTCTNGSIAVTGTDTEFNTAWAAATEIYISGVLYHIASVASKTSLTLQENFAEASAANLGWSVPGNGQVVCPGSGDTPQTFAGGCQSGTDFLATTKGYMADPRWVDPAQFIFYRGHSGAAPAWKYGGVDLDADGQVTEKDKCLRDWALWQFRRDAFLPEGMDNHDLFQPGLHANNRRLWSNGTTYDYGYEFVDPKLVGDSFYLIFRSDPLYSLASNVSADPTMSIGDPLDGSSDPGVKFDGRTDQAGYRYPYDRTHLNKWSTVPWDSDMTGGLSNINGCNNDYNIEQLTNSPGSGAVPASLTWYHYPEAKWIYCYDPLEPTKRYGRYAVTVQPDGGTWNASAMHSGYVNVLQTHYHTVSGVGYVSAAGGFISSLRAGFNPKTGDPTSASFLQANAFSGSPVRPSPLPYYWANVSTDAGGWYYSGDGAPDAPQTNRYPPVDFTRAVEIYGGHGGSNPWSTGIGSHGKGGVRVSIFNYMIWLGPYDSRAEFATHLRKSCLVRFDPYYPTSSPDRYGTTGPDSRRCMEEANTSDAAVAKLASDARMLAALSTVQGYYYTLDRFWDRDLLVMNDGTGSSGSDTDARFTTAQCSRTVPIDTATAAAKPGQKTRQFYIDMMNDLECFGGYRTRDGNYKLLNYLFHSDSTGHVGYTRHEAYTGGAVGSGNPQKFTSRRQKFMAMTISRLACQQRYTASAKTAACPNGHLVHNPRISTFHKPVYVAPDVTYALRTASTDPTLDEIGQGCPVCGAKLFQAAIHELNINEIGRFREKFNNAERPTRHAFNVENPIEKPMRHFVELICNTDPDNSTYCGQTNHNPLGQFDLLSSFDTAKGVWKASPGVLCDPVTLMPYFTAWNDFDMRFLKLSDDSIAMDPEPIFKSQGRRGSSAYYGGWDWRLLVHDDDTGRWHDVTRNIDAGSFCIYYGSGVSVRSIKDPALYNGQVVSFSATADPVSTNWTTLSVRADEKYVMSDPDPAHQQEADARGLTAAVSVYRKMPVRWYGGDRPSSWDVEFNRYTGQWGNYPLPTTWTDAAWQPTNKTVNRGLAFAAVTGVAMRFRIYTNQYGIGGSYSGDGWDQLYKGDYDVAANAGGWPGPTTRSGISTTNARTLDPASKLREVRQYGVITFDASFDGSKVALVGCASDKVRPNYTSYRIIDYVELTDSAGAPIKISAAAGQADPLDPTKILSWQNRHGLDNRSNADGYMCWDLLPMTLQNTDHTGGLVAATGYEPWRVVGQTANTGWWGNGSDGFFAGQANRISAQGDPPGYMDIRGRICNNRNTNDYTRNYPTRRRLYDGLGTLESLEARAERLVWSRHDMCLNDSGRTPKVKECSISVPTGIGRQVAAADAIAPGGTPIDPASWPANYAGRQHALPKPAGVATWIWTEGNNTADPKHKWGAYSWNSWHDIYYVTDLCQRVLYKLGITAEERDIFDGDQDGVRDELATSSMTYKYNGGSADAISGRFSGEVKQINKMNLNELWYPPSFGGTGWNASYTSFGRKPLKGFHAPSDAMTYHYSSADYLYRIKPWDLYDDASTDLQDATPDRHSGRFDAAHCSSSPVYTIFVTGNAVDDQGEPLAEMRARVTVERTWDGRMNILEFTWLPTDRGFME
jgi:hypothetical protein